MKYLLYNQGTEEVLRSDELYELVCRAGAELHNRQLFIKNFITKSGLAMSFKRDSRETLWLA